MSKKTHKFTYRVTIAREVTFTVNDTDSDRAERFAETMLAAEYRGEAHLNPTFECVEREINETIPIPFPENIKANG